MIGFESSMKKQTLMMGIILQVPLFDDSVEDELRVGTGTVLLAVLLVLHA